MLSIFLNQQPIPTITEHQPVEFVLLTPNLATTCAVDGVVLEAYQRPGDQDLRWRWNPGAAPGTHRLIIQYGTDLQFFEIQVLPRHLDLEQYALLTEDLWRTAHELMLMLGGARTPAELARQTQPSGDLLSDYYALIEGHVDGFARAVQRISRQPRTQLQAQQQQRPLDQTAMIDPAAPLERLSPTTPLILPEVQAVLGGRLPAETSVRVSSETHNTYENRLLRRTLEMLLRRVRGLHAAARKVRAQARTPVRSAEAERMVQMCVAAQQRLQELQLLPWLADVGELSAYSGPTPALQRDPAYRVILRTYMALRRAPQLTLDQPIFQLPLAELPTLYEYWCVLQVARTLLGITGGHETQSLLDDSADLVQFKLTPGILLRIAISQQTLLLRYQPRYRPAGANLHTLHSLDRHTRVPDLVIEARAGDAPPRLLLFDAKYRLERADSRQAESDAPLGVPQDALAEAYAYHGAIGQAGKPCVDVAFLLYPGHGAAEQYPGGVGAIPLLPGANQLLETVLRVWIAGLEA